MTSAQDSSGKVPIGARYTYTSLVTAAAAQQHSDEHAVILPSQYPSSSKVHSATASNTNVKKASKGKYAMRSTSQHHQRSSSSPHKSFDAFLKDTNDEWSDELGFDEDASKQQKTLLSHRKTLSTTASKSRSPQLSVTAHPPPPLPKSVARKTPRNPGGVKDNIEKLLQDPTFIVYSTNPNETSDPAKSIKFKTVLSETNVDLAALRKLSWSGIPKEYRAVAWQLLLGYLPCNSGRRVTALAQKRKDYIESVTASYAKGTAGLDQGLWHQIHIDIPRTNPGVPLYQYEATKMCLERILYQWAIRHPASGYVQGINDLVTPIFEVFLSAYIEEDPEEYDVSQLDPNVLSVIEADSFWCLSKLLDGIQDNYTFAQPGIQRQVMMLKELVSRIDTPLAKHLDQEGVQFIQFAFRWMNCLLMRELPLQSIIRMWDTYLAEGSSDGFSEFHVYVCAAFLEKWSKELQQQDFQGIMIFLQQLPTQDWQEKDVELLLSEAYMYKALFHDAQSHLK